MSSLKHDRKVLLIHLLLSLWLSVFAFLCRTLSPEYGLGLASVTFTVSAVWVIGSWKISGRKWMTPYAIFLLAALAFNGGQILLYTFDRDYDMLQKRVSVETLVTTVLVVTGSIMFLHLGALLVPHTKLKSTRTVEGARIGERYVSLSLLVISFVPSVLTFGRAVKSIATKGYMAGLYQGDVSFGADNAAALIAQFLLPAVFLLVASHRNSRLVRRVSVLLVVLYAVTYLFIGVRSAAMMSLLGFAWLWEFHVAKLPRHFLLGTTAGILFLLPCIAALRNADTQGRTTLAEDAVSGVMSSPVHALLGETGNSMLTVAHTIDLYPSARSYDTGASYGYALLTILPNVFGTELHPSVAHGRLADWLVETIDPTIAAIGGGYGYSFIAEAYANFGITGVLGFSLLLGLLLQGLYSWTCAYPAAHRVAFTASVLSMILIYVRGESGSIVRGLIWYGVLPYTAIHLTERVIPYLRQTVGVLPIYQSLPRVSD